MKTIEITTIVIMLMGSMTIHSQTKEVKGIKHTYLQKEVPGLFVIYNKNNTPHDVISPYELYEHTPPITVGNRWKLNEIVYTYFTPYFKKYTGNFKQSTALTIFFLSNMDGVLKEVQISYPLEVGEIPASVIEEFEAAVLKSTVKLVFDKNLREFKGSTWVTQYAAYNSDKLRDYKEIELPILGPPTTLEKK